MRPGCFMTSVDLKDAYYYIPIALQHQKYLKFIWRDKLYCFTCLPMGLSSSPRVFTKVMSQFLPHLDLSLDTPVLAILMTPFIQRGPTRNVSRLPLMQSS
jgi:hypothetical protein